MVRKTHGVDGLWLLTLLGLPLMVSCVHDTECIDPATKQDGRCVLNRDAGGADSGVDAEHDVVIAVDVPDDISSPEDTLDAGPPSIDVGEVAVGNAHVCVLSAEGDVFCQGDNTFGQLGVRSERSDVWERVEIRSGMGAVLSAQTLTSRADTTCAIAGTQLYCWGRNTNQQVDGRVGEDAFAPTLVDGGAELWTAIAAGDEYTCGIVQEGRVLCWGMAYGVETPRPFPAGVIVLDDGSTLEGATALAAGDRFACAISADQTYCWGDARDGRYELAGMEQAQYASLQTVLPAQAISITSTHSCVTLTDVGTPNLCRGDNSQGQISSMEPTPVTMPVTIGSTSDADVLAGPGYSCVIRAGGTVACRGDNSNGQLGIGSATPVDGLNEVPGVEGASMLRASSNGRTCAVATGGVFCWGGVPESTPEMLDLTLE